MRKALIGLVALAISVPAFAHDEPLYPDNPNVRRKSGQCLRASMIAGGTLSEDISQPDKQRPFRCNFLQMQKLPGDRIVISFSQFNDPNGKLVGYEGSFATFQKSGDDTTHDVVVDHIWFGQRRVRATEGDCRLFYEGGYLVSLSCGGHAVTDGSQYAVTAGFVVQN